MTLRFSRSLEEMRPVLMDPAASGPDPVYEVFMDLDSSWINKTVIHPGLFGQEFPKTFGHYHAVSTPETYSVESGSGFLILQSPTEIFLVSAKPSDRITITQEFGHSWVNVGKEDLVLSDDWNNPHSPTEYQPVADKHGLGYYLISDNGSPQAVLNPNYPNLPSPKWLTAEEFSNRQR